MNDMDANSPQTILLEILRVGLIAIRNLSELPSRNRQADEKLRHWANLCHSLPAILLGGSDNRAVSYFAAGDMKLFYSRYPSPHDADFGQILALRDALIVTEADTPVSPNPRG